MIHVNLALLKVPVENARLMIFKSVLSVTWDTTWTTVNVLHVVLIVQTVYHHLIVVVVLMDTTCSDYSVNLLVYVRPVLQISSVPLVYTVPLNVHHVLMITP